LSLDIEEIATKRGLLCDDGNGPLAQPATEEKLKVQAVIVLHLGGAADRADLPAALKPILGRNALQRHLVHLARLGLRRCAVLMTGSRISDWIDTVRRSVLETPLSQMCVTLWPAESVDTATVTAQLADQVLWVEGEAVFDPRLYSSVWAAPAPVQLRDGRKQDSSAEATASALSSLEGMVGIGLAKLGSDSAVRLLAAAQNGSITKAERAERGPSSASGLIDVGELPDYVPGLRRHLRPYWCRLRRRDDFRRAEGMLLDSAQKGVLDFPARVLHPIPENLLTRLLARTSVTPNLVTVVTGVIAFVATYLFAVQSYAWGLGIALLVNVLDGVDGKLARVKLLSSRFGDRLDHFLDVSFEFSWYLALGWGLSAGTGNWQPLGLALGLVAVMLAARGLSGVYRLLQGHQIHDHRPFDRAFRWVAGRRNIYVWLFVVGALLGHVDRAYEVVLGWGAATMTVYLVRTAMAFAGRNK